MTYGEVPLDICSSEKLLPPQTDVELRFTHASDTFRIHSDLEESPYVLQVEQMELTVTRYTLPPDLTARIDQRLAKGEPIVYHIARQAILGPMEVSERQT